MEQNMNNNDAPNTGFFILCFFFPIVGLILWLIWKDEMPQKAKSCGKGGLIGFIMGIVGYFVLVACTTALLLAV